MNDNQRFPNNPVENYGDNSFMTYGLICETISWVKILLANLLMLLNYYYYYFLTMSIVFDKILLTQRPIKYRNGPRNVSLN